MTTPRAATHEALRREPLPLVHSAWEGDERTAAAYLDGWRSARDYYAGLISHGWPHTDPCLTVTCLLQRGHAGDHTPGTGQLQDTPAANGTSTAARDVGERELIDSVRRRPDGRWAAVSSQGATVRGTVGRSRAETIGKIVLLSQAGVTPAAGSS